MRCRNPDCRYYFRERVEFCPKCGLRHPILEGWLKVLDQAIGWVPYVVGGCLFAGYALADDGMGIGSAVLSFVLGIALVGPIGEKSARILSGKFLLAVHRAQGLLEGQKTTRERIKLIESRSSRHDRLARDLEAQGAGGEAALETIRRNQDVLHDLGNTFIYKRQQIEFFLIVNELEGITAALDSHKSENTLNADIERVESLLKEVQSVAAELKRRFFGDSLPQKHRDLIQTIEATVADIQKLQKAMAQRYATLSVSDISAAGPDHVLDVLQPEYFSARVAVGELLSSMEELENQFVRIEAEQGASWKP